MILILEQHQVAQRVDPRGQACGVECHHRHQRVGSRGSQRRGRDQAGQAQGLEAQVAPDQVLAFMRGVAFVEDEVQHLERGIEAGFQLLTVGQVQRHAALADLALGAHQPLRDGRFLGQKRAGDLAHAESASGLEAQRDAGLARDLRMAAHQDHAQLVVAEFGTEVGIEVEFLGRCGFLRPEIRVLALHHAFLAQQIERQIASGAKQPRRRVFRHALKRPDFERAQHGLLRDLFGQVQPRGAEQPGQMRGHPPGHLPEQMFQQLTRFRGPRHGH